MKPETILFEIRICSISKLRKNCNICLNILDRTVRGVTVNELGTDASYFSVKQNKTYIKIRNLERDLTMQMPQLIDNYNYQ